MTGLPIQKNKDIKPGSNPVFHDRNSPQQADELRFPINNSQLRDQALANGLYLKGELVFTLMEIKSKYEIIGNTVITSAEINHR